MKLTLLKSALSGNYAKKFIKYGTFSPTPLSLAKLANFGETANPSKSATFLREELPVRLANIMQEIHLMPEKLIKTPSASLVVSWYEQSFCNLIDFEAEDFNVEDNVNKFTDVLAKIRDRHTHVVQTMAEGVMELRDRHGIDILVNNQVQYFLDRFYMMRISIRMLINQHVLLFGPQLDTHRRYLGSIDLNCDVLEILKHSYEDAKYLCQHYYAGAPEIEYKLHNPSDDGAVKLVYVPSHLYHITFELMKNAMRAVMENREFKSVSKYPPIQILVSMGNENISIKMSDRGGGIPRSVTDLVFNYTYTTGQNRHGAETERLEETPNAPLAGYGYGLPLSRLYARYFNGDLALTSVEGYGTDVVLYLKRHETEADEVLPIFNTTTRRHYGLSSIPVGDWSSSLPAMR